MKGSPAIAARPGEALQQLVRLIEIGVASNPNVSVESPVRLRDLDTGRLREHDVLVTLREGHHEVRVALECRDRSRKVGVPDVEAFAIKCRRTSVDKGIIVSGSGFTETAREKARANGIGCFSLEASPQFDWIRASAMEHVQRNVRSVSVRFELSDGLNPDLTPATIYFSDGSEITREILMGFASSGLSQLEPDWPQDASPEVTYALELDLEVNEEQRPYLIGNDGKRHEIAGGRMVVGFQIEITSLPFNFHSYSDFLEQVGITQAATTSFAVEGRAAHLVVSTQKDGAKSVKVVVDAPTKARR